LGKRHVDSSMITQLRYRVVAEMSFCIRRPILVQLNLSG